MNQQKIDLLKELNEFSGTANYYKSTFGKLKLTDGMHYLREKADCYWLIDIVESVQHLKEIKDNNCFIVWRIEVNMAEGLVEAESIVEKNKEWKVTGWNDTPYKSDMLYSQTGKYTDFPFKEYEFYQCGDVLLLKGEY